MALNEYFILSVIHSPSLFLVHAPSLVCRWSLANRLTTFKMISNIATLAVAVFATVSSATIIPRQSGSLSPVSSEGNAFWKEDGSRFYVRGVAYQPGGAADAADPMLDLDTFRNDVKQFKELGINTIRIYTIDNSANHDEAMALLDDAGIYLALDVNTPKYSLNRASTSDIHMSYNDVYLQSVFATVDAFAGYSKSSR